MVVAEKATEDFQVAFTVLFLGDILLNRDETNHVPIPIGDRGGRQAGMILLA